MKLKLNYTELTTAIQEEMLLTIEFLLEGLCQSGFTFLPSLLSYGSFVSLYFKDISLKKEDFFFNSVFAFHSLNFPPLTYICAFLKK